MHAHGLRLLAGGGGLGSEPKEHLVVSMVSGWLPHSSYHEHLLLVPGATGLLARSIVSMKDALDHCLIDLAEGL